MYVEYTFLFVDTLKTFFSTHRPSTAIALCRARCHQTWKTTGHRDRPYEISAVADGKKEMSVLLDLLESKLSSVLAVGRILVVELRPRNESRMLFVSLFT